MSRPKLKDLFSSESWMRIFVVLIRPAISAVRMVSPSAIASTRPASSTFAIRVLENENWHSEVTSHSTLSANLPITRKRCEALAPQRVTS